MSGKPFGLEPVEPEPVSQLPQALTLTLVTELGSSVVTGAITIAPSMIVAAPNLPPTSVVSLPVVASQVTSATVWLINQPLVITIPNSVKPVVTGNYDLSTPFVVTFQPEGGRTKSIQLVNARTEISAWWPLSARPQDCLRLDSPMFVQEADHICLEVESVQGLAWRNFVNSTINEKSPLIILAAGLLSGAGAIGSQWLKKRQAAEVLAKEERAKREAQEKQEQQKDENRRRVSDALQEFHVAMCDQQSAKARQAFGEMQKSELAPYVSSEDLERARYLTTLMDGEISEPWISSAAAIWPNETAGALAHAAKNAPKDRDNLLRAFRTFPLDKLAPEYRQSFEKANEEFGVPSLQASKWPRLPEFHGRQQSFSPGSVAKKIGFNLFTSEYAEEEKALLFDKLLAFFWPNHTLCQHMMANSIPEIIWGRPGTGKTALGLALGEYPPEETLTLGCYLAGLPALSSIQMSFASKLLTFVQYHPTFLSRLGQYDRHLLAQLLVGLLSRELVLAKIRKLPDEVTNWQKEPSDERSQLLRESNVLTQLRLLEQDVNAVAAKPDWTETQWSLALVHCAHVLGFEQIRLVLDAAGGKCSEWLQRFVLPSLSVWTEAGIVVKIIVPDDVATTLQSTLHFSLVSSLAFRQLHWQKDWMLEMIKWRSEQLNSVGLAEVIAEDVLDKMIASSRLNPRCFVQLWNAVAALNPEDGRITFDMLQQAEKQVTCL